MDADSKIKCPVRINYGPVRINYGPVRINYGPVRINYGPVRINYGPLSKNHGVAPKMHLTVHKKCKQSFFFHSKSPTADFIKKSTYSLNHISTLYQSLCAQVAFS